MVNTSIITIGDELLIGQVIDTNSAWMAQQLNKAGIMVNRRVAVGDSWEMIWQALDEEMKHADIILITGGLGPTADDITKPLLCKYFGGKMLTNEAVLEDIRTLFEKVFKRELTERNIRQAEVPDVCTVIPNKRGTAPGMWFEKEGKVFVSMPGVPHEMKGMMEASVIPALIKRFSVQYITHRTLLTYGIGESSLADMLVEFEASLPDNIKLAYLPNYGMVRLRLTSTGIDQMLVEQTIDDRFELLKKTAGEYVISGNDEKMEEIVARLLKETKKTVCTAESCTGGYIAHLLTSLPGSSVFYEGSIVSYSYKAKEALLDVDDNLLQEKGAVSEEVVVEMAKGALQKLKTDYAIAVSGIMGPAGGTPEKPVGTVWMAAGNQESIITRKFHFRFERALNIQLTAVQALNLLRTFILLK